MTEVAVTEALGELLSPSQVNTYLTCPAKWYFRYLVGLSEPATGALARGKAFHGTLQIFPIHLTTSKPIGSPRGGFLQVAVSEAPKN